VGREEHEAGLADKVLDWNETDALPRCRGKAAVERIVAVVAHHEQMAFGHQNRPGIVGIDLILKVQTGRPEIEDVVADAARKGFTELRIAAEEGALGRSPGILLTFTAALGYGRRGDEIRHLLFRYRLAVADQRAAHDLHRISRQADHALDVVAAIDRMLEDCDVAAVGQAAEYPALATRPVYRQRGAR